MLNMDLHINDAIRQAMSGGRVSPESLRGAFASFGAKMAGAGKELSLANPAILEKRAHITDVLRRQFGGSPVQQAQGFYYSSVEAVFGADGTAADPVLYIPAGTETTCFNYSIGDTITRGAFGGTGGVSHTATAIDTNVQNPGTQLYPDQVFLIEGISKHFRGYKMRLTVTAGQNHAVTTYQQSLIAGGGLIYDEQGLLLPSALVNPSTGGHMIQKALGAAATLRFKWADAGLGANSDTRTILVDTFEQVPERGAASVKHTSGAAAQLDAGEGYVWNLNQSATADTGGGGIFSAILRVEEDIAIPIEHYTPYGSGTDVIPTAVAALFEIRVHGTSFRKG